MFCRGLRRRAESRDPLNSSSGLLLFSGPHLLQHGRVGSGVTLNTSCGFLDVMCLSKRRIAKLLGVSLSAVAAVWQMRVIFEKKEGIKETWSSHLNTIKNKQNASLLS